MEESRQYIPQGQEYDKLNARTEGDEIVIPVIQEQLIIDKQVIETGKVRVRKTVTEETASLNIPLLQEKYEVQRVAAQQVFDKPLGIRYEGETIVVPVMREIVIVEKKYELIEEIHLTKRTTAIPHIQEIILQKEHVQVERIQLDEPGSRNP